MSVLTDLTNARIKSKVTRLTGTIASPPALLVTDGVNLTYACDVNISQLDSSAHIDQYKHDLLGIPGTHGFHALTDPLTTGTILRNVVIARNNYALIYADVGAAVQLERSESGQWQIVGFAEEQAGTYTLVPVDLGDMTIGTIQDLSVSVRLLTLGEIGIYAGGWGVCPFGAYGIFLGGVFQRIQL